MNTNDAGASPVEPTVRPCAWAHRYSPRGLLHTLRDNRQDAEDDAAIVGGSAHVVALYDEQTLWNACARVGEIERGKLADDTADALRFRWLCRYPDWHFIEHLCRQTTASTSTDFLADLRRVIDARRSVELGPLEQHVPPKA